MKNTSPKIYVICGLILLSGFLMSFYLYSSIVLRNEIKKEQILLSYFNNVQIGLQREIDRNLNALYSIRAFYMADRSMGFEEFSRYSTFYTNSIKSIQALEWVPVISLDQRDSFENYMQVNGFPNFQITSRINDSIIRAENRETYYPVTFIEPLKGNEKALGFDPGDSMEVRQEVIEKAISSGEASTSVAINIIQKDVKDKALLVFVPVIDSSSKKTIALVEGVYLIKKLIESSLENQNFPEELKIFIMAEDNPVETLYGDFFEKSENTKEGKIYIADRVWNLSLDYSRLRTASSYSPYLTLIVSLFFTLLLTRFVYIYLSGNRKTLIKYIKELKKKNRDLEQYAYVASHDLQEPLHSLKGLVDIIKLEYEDKFDEQGKKYLDHMVLSSNRMSKLINNLLQYSRIGQSENPELLDIRDVIYEAMENLSSQIKENNAQINIQKNMPTLLVYPEAFKQLIQNLLSNALKFQKDGNRAEIDVSCYQNDNKEWEFAIKDNGIGFEKEQSDHIFVIFKRLHTNVKYKGTGIGLANCKKIVDLHSGEIWADSVPGSGSTFYFTLNLSK